MNNSTVIPAGTQLHTLSATDITELSATPDIAVNGRDECQRVLFSLWKEPLLHRVKSELGIATRRGFMSLKGERRSLVLERGRVIAAEIDDLKPLPPLVAVRSDGTGVVVPGLTDNLEIVLAVLSRCSASAFHLHRAPIVSVDNLARQATLLLPKSWSLDP